MRFAASEQKVLVFAVLVFRARIVRPRFLSINIVLILVWCLICDIEVSPVCWVFLRRGFLPRLTHYLSCYLIRSGFTLMPDIAK